MINLELMNKRLQYEGGNQEQRMIKSKYLTFKKALLYSYQAAEVKKIEEEDIRKALINPDKNSENYDDKIISIDYAFDFKPGDIFEWIGTHTYWLVYLQELTEDAYFRSSIRKCNYELYWVNMEEQKDNRKKSSYAYIKGPVETTIDSIKNSNKEIIDLANYTLEIFLPNNPETLKYFKRYQKFAFNNKVWEIQSVDDISIIGILQIIAKEDYENTVLDDSDKEKITEAFYLHPVAEIISDEIKGDNFIKPLGKYKYTIDIPDGVWDIKEKNIPLIIKPNGQEIEIQWTSSKSGQFTLVYQKEENFYLKTIVVESLF